MVKPFVRPSVDITPRTRSWMTIPAYRIALGDIVPDYGLVVEIVALRVFGRTVEDVIRLLFLSGKSKEYDFDQEVFVFHGDRE